MQLAFINAIHHKLKIRVIFYSKEDGRVITRLCAPMDYGPGKKIANKNNRFHVWDYESDKKPHPLILPPEQIKEIQILSETFDPSEFVTWTIDWNIPRNWGIYS